MSEKVPVISIDFKTKKRIRIHKVTLRLLKDPNYIQLLINPESKAIALRSSSSNDPLSIKVNRRMIEDNSYELCSLDLSRSLILLYESWKEGRSYRIYGKMSSDSEVAVFYIKNMVEIGENR